MIPNPPKLMDGCGELISNDILALGNLDTPTIPCGCCCIVGDGERLLLVLGVSLYGIGWILLRLAKLLAAASPAANAAKLISSLIPLPDDPA